MSIQYFILPKYARLWPVQTKFFRPHFSLGFHGPLLCKMWEAILATFAPFFQFLYSLCILLPFHFVFRSSRAAATGKGEGRLFLATTDHRPPTPVMMKQRQKLRKEEAEDRRARDISLGPHIHSFILGTRVEGKWAHIKRPMVECSAVSRPAAGHSPRELHNPPKGRGASHSPQKGTEREEGNDRRGGRLLAPSGGCLNIPLGACFKNDHCWGEDSSNISTYCIEMHAIGEL